MRSALVLVLTATLLMRPADGRAQDLAADISDHLIAITTAFVGTTVTLFGVSDDSGNIVVTVIGPRSEQVVRRKDRIGGIWVNADEMTFADVPEFYFVASSRPIGEIAHPDIQARLELGLEHLNLRPVDAEGRAISTSRGATWTPLTSSGSLLAKPNSLKNCILRSAGSE